MQISSTMGNVGSEALTCEYYVHDYAAQIYIYIVYMNSNKWSIFDMFMNQLWLWRIGASGGVSTFNVQRSGTYRIVRDQFSRMQQQKTCTNSGPIHGPLAESKCVCVFFLMAKNNAIRHSLFNDFDR